MNGIDLTTWIYIAQVSDGLQWVFAAAMAFGGIAFVAISIHRLFEGSLSTELIAIRKRCVIAVIVGAICTLLVPSSQTMRYMIAAHYGENILLSETGDKAKQELDALLDSLIEKHQKGK